MISIKKTINIVIGAFILNVSFNSLANQTFRLSASSSASDDRAVAINQYLAPVINEFGTFEGHWGSTLFKQGTELEALARGNLDMSLTSAQEIAQFIPSFSIFAAGYVHRDPQHQIDVFNSPFFEKYKQQVEDRLNIKLLNVMYFGTRHVSLRIDKTINTPEDMAGIKLRMPGSRAWQFLGQALGANPTPIAFTEVYTALQTGAIDGQDNPISTSINMKFNEVTEQVVLTGHLVDLNYIAMSLKVWNELTQEQQEKVLNAAQQITAHMQETQIEKEQQDIEYLEEQGIKVYSPDIEAFRNRVQNAYLNSEYSESWEEGLLEKINQL